MRKKIVAGNWKMNLTLQEGLQLSAEIADFAKKNPLEKLNHSPQVIMFTPFTHIASVSDSVKGIQGLSSGAQNCHTEEKGAFTGETSVSMIKSAGAINVLVGHSERRAYFGETNEVLAKKVKVAMDAGLTPMYCCGEVLEERNTGNHFEVVKEQLEKGIFWLSAEEFAKVVIAYEPVWAIGTGVTASPEQAQEMHAYIRGLVKDKYNDDVAENTSILYGGSCNAKNAAELFANKDVDGGLIGGASLKAEDFCTIIQSF
ncbi:MAG: triose-phosphate isomerase [Bacteroidetes bacterium]|nr:MAG: triose-phosphate isomerase [Bacteroidota bacterium]